MAKLAEGPVEEPALTVTFCGNYMNISFNWRHPLTINPTDPRRVARPDLKTGHHRAPRSFASVPETLG